VKQGNLWFQVRETVIMSRGHTKCSRNEVQRVETNSNSSDNQEKAIETCLQQCGIWTMLDGTSIWVWVCSHRSWVTFLEAHQTEASDDKKSTVDDNRANNSKQHGAWQIDNYFPNKDRIESNRAGSTLLNIEKNCIRLIFPKSKIHIGWMYL